MTQNLTSLLKKYDVQGPRYTSYPTVPYWETDPTEDQWIQHLQHELDRSIASQSGAAIYIHLPFCESLCTFCACNKIITKKKERAERYIGFVHREWELYKNKLDRSYLPVSEIHLGGGTPTFLSPQELEMLMIPILKDIQLLPHAELSFEADPRVTSTTHLEMLYQLGFRRISLGIQDYDLKVQQAIHRVQSVELVSKLTQESRATGFTGVNFDLVYGLPHQKIASIEETINHVIIQRPDRIAFYAYAHVPWVGKTGQRGFNEDDLPSGDEKRALYERGRALLQNTGYIEIGMDHFALSHDPLFKAFEQKTLFRNFMGYVPYHVSPLIGLGVTSISDAWTCFAQNEKEMPDYEAKILAGHLPLYRGHVLTDEDRAIREVILKLMTQFETDWSGQKYIDQELVSILLKEAANDDLITFNNQRLRVNEIGKPFIRNICMAFDARLQRKKPDTQIFSRTI
jgi:oxygen-independent coproporphyrinogen-3 oxidase